MLCTIPGAIVTLKPAGLCIVLARQQETLCTHALDRCLSAKLGRVIMFTRRLRGRRCPRARRWHRASADDPLLTRLVSEHAKINFTIE